MREQELSFVHAKLILYSNFDWSDFDLSNFTGQHRVMIKKDQRMRKLETATAVVFLMKIVSVSD